MSTINKPVLHLCSSCVQHFAECLPELIEFGNGFGDDNVIDCSGYIRKKVE